MATENREPRDVLSDTNVYMKCVPFENKEGGYFIGNCNIEVGLKNTVLRFVPPHPDDVEAAQAEGRKAVGRLVILNGTYNNEEFEEFMSETEDLEGIPAYFHGLCNMDINALDTVIKFFPERFDERNVLLINQTQRRDGKKIDNPMEVKIFMRCKNLR
ncbi:MAG: hypothetical protein ACWGQW_05945 [bacterium]